MFLRCFLLFLFGSFFAFGNPKPLVIVSVAPYKNFVEKVAGETVEVFLIVPPGVSAHHYEPSLKEMLKASRAHLWFGTGEPFENKAFYSLKRQNPEMRFVDFKEVVDLIDCNQGKVHCCKACGGQDLHYWLSPKENKKQLVLIKEELQALFPEHKELYEENTEAALQELDQIEEEIRTRFQGKHPTIVVSHPAYAYFARDFGLEQVSVEFEGREPTPKQVAELVETARKKKVKTIFVQPQYNNKAAYLVAKEIGAEVVVLDPYAEQVFETLREISEAFDEPTDSQD